MADKILSAPLPRRALLASAGLAALATTARAGGRPPAVSLVRVTVTSEGDAFWGVTAHFRLPDGGSVPFYAWNGGTATSFTMPLTREGLRLSVEGEAPQEITLTARGEYVLTRGKGASASWLRIAVSAE